MAVPLLAACGSDDDGGAATQGAPETGADGVGPSTGSSPFTVGPAPEGYDPIVAGTGTERPVWGSDSFGTDEPYTVLSPEGATTGEDVVVVALTGYAGYEGGLFQASTGDASTSPEELTHDGRDAIFTPASDRRAGRGWADLVVVRDGEVAVRVTSPTASRDELLAVLDGIRPQDGHRDAPEVDIPGHQVVGSVDLSGAVAARAYVFPASEEVPGPQEAHSVGWAGPGGRSLSVQTLPGDAVDLGAVEAWRGADAWSSTARRRDGPEGPAVVVERTEDTGDQIERSLWTEAPWGDVVVVRATGRAPLPSEEQLASLAASVEPTDQGTWDAFVTQARGGPGLHPDDGQVEITRGTVEGTDWLLQTRPDRNPRGGEPLEPDVDECILRSSGPRRCTNLASAGDEDGNRWFLSVADRDQEGDPPLPDSVVVTTAVDGASVRATTAAGAETAPLVDVPGADLRAAVVFLDGVAAPRCDDGAGGAPRPPVDVGAMRLEVLDADDAVLACLG